MPLLCWLRPQSGDLGRFVEFNIKALRYLLAQGVLINLGKLMPYQYQGFCHETLEQAVVDELDNGLFVVGSTIYLPVSYSLGTDSALLNYVTDLGVVKSFTRNYPACTDIGYPSITGLSLEQSLLLNAAVIACWSIAYAFKVARRSF